VQVLARLEGNYTSSEEDYTPIPVPGPVDPLIPTGPARPGRGQEQAEGERGGGGRDVR
jgi:hypothetical protein